MGTVKFLLIVLLFFFNSVIAQQNVAILIEKTDSAQITKYERDKLYLTIYNRQNIKYNKSKTKVKRVDGIVECQNCKRENITFVVKKISSSVKTIKKCTTLSNFTTTKNLYYFSGYFLKDKIYYKNYGRIVE